MKKKDYLRVCLAQIAPSFLNKQKTINKITQIITQAAQQYCQLITFGESILPGYPFWISLTDGAKFNSTIQKELYAHYVENAITIEDGELDIICKLAKENKMAVYLGIAERAKNRGGHSVYCSLVYINEKGKIISIHRKLQATYEERLVWAAGDGNGLQVHSLGAFTLGGLNCWENWMPLSRTALYGMGENLHVAVWPGADYNTKDITRFIARESRSYVLSVSGFLSIEDIPEDTPYKKEIIEHAPKILSNGGSCIAGPDGEFIIEPVINKEDLIIVDLDFSRVLQERQNFDVAGHYSRPDVTKLVLNTERQAIIEFSQHNKSS